MYRKYGNKWKKFIHNFLFFFKCLKFYQSIKILGARTHSVKNLHMGQAVGLV